MSAPSLDEILPLLRDLAAARQPSLSQAADTAVRLHAAVQNVRSEQPEYTRLDTNACELLYVVAEGLRERGERNVDNELKRGLDELTGIIEKILELAEANAARGIFSSFWNSDANNLKALREQLEQRLRVFGIRSFSDLQYKAKERVQTKNVNTTTVNNSGNFQKSNLSHINQGDNSTVNQGNNYKQEMFPNARNFEIHGSEFNNVQGDMNKLAFTGKNVAPNFGKVGSQAFS